MNLKKLREEPTIENANAIETAGLRKSFGNNEVLKGIDLRVKKGSVFAVLGPNGAGKTTLMNILSTLLRPDAGTARVFGHDVVREAAAARARIGMTGQFASVDEDMSGRDNLTLFGRLAGYSAKAAAARADMLLEAFSLADAGKRAASHYSGGMRRRLDIAGALLVMPELLFLDEPTTGLDPRSRNEVWEIVRTLVSQGMTVLLTTQYLEEADRLADRLAVIDHGTVIAEGTAGELKTSVGSGSVRLRLLRPDQRGDAVRILSETLGTAARTHSDATFVSAPLSDPEAAGQTLIALTRAGIAVEQFALDRPSLDEVFLALTGRPAEEKEPEVTLS